MTTFAFYGTLLPKEHRGEHSFLRQYGHFGEECLINGGLYSVHGAYPALVTSECDIVCGRLWHSHPGYFEAACEELDAIEGYCADDPRGSLYLRVRVELADPKLTAWTYVWNGSTVGLPRISSGDWPSFALGARQRTYATP